MITKLKKFRFSSVAFIFLFLLQMTLALICCNLKSGFHVDEMWSFGLSNSFYFPHVFWNGYMDQSWIDPNFIHSYLTVDPAHKFRFDSVYFNLSNDAHPPLYFFILHAISSLFPGVFSKWFGLVPNLIFYALTLILIFSLSKILFKDDIAALGPVALWGFSPIALNLVTLIRMYLLLIVFALIYLNVIYRIYSESCSACNLFALFVITFLGFITHFYFYIFVFVSSLVFGMYFLVKRGLCFALKFGMVTVCSVALSFVYFPSAISNMFGNHYAEAAASQSGVHVLIHRLVLFFQQSSNDFFFNSKIVLIVFSLLVIGAFLVSSIKFRGDFFSERVRFLTLIFVSSLNFYILASYISPFFSSRYVCLAYPGFLFFAYGTLFFTACSFIRLENNLAHVKHFECARQGRFIYKIIVVPVLLVCISNLLVFPSSNRYILAKSGANERAVASYENSEGLFISYDYYQLTAKLTEASHLSRIHALIPDKAVINDFCDRETISSDNLIVYMNDRKCAHRVLNQLKRKLGYSRYESLPGYSRVEDGTTCFAYVLFK